MKNLDTLRVFFDRLSQSHKDLQIELFTRTRESVSVSHQKGEIDKFSLAQGRMTAFRVIKAGHEGFASTEDFSETGLTHAFERAHEALKIFLAQAPETEFELPKTSPSFKSNEAPFDFGALPVKKIIELSRQLEDKLKKFDPRIKASPYNQVSETHTETTILNSHGLFATEQRRMPLAYGTALAEQGEIRKSGSIDRHPVDLSESVIDEIVQEAGALAISLLNSQKLKSGRFDCVFSSQTAAQLLERFDSFFSAKEIVQGTSIFNGKMGEKIASPLLTLSDDPFSNPPFTSNFDYEGTAARKISLIEKGVLKSYLADSKWGKRLGIASTGSAGRSGIGAQCYTVEAGTSSADELRSASPRTIYIEGFAGGAGFRASSGEFSLPIDAFLYENGKRVCALEDVILASSVFEVLKNIAAVGSDLPKRRHSALSPELLVRDLSIAGVT